MDILRGDQEDIDIWWDAAEGNVSKENWQTYFSRKYYTTGRNIEPQVLQVWSKLQVFLLIFCKTQNIVQNVKIVKKKKEKC